MFTDKERELLEDLIRDQILDFHNIAISDEATRNMRIDAVRAIKLLTSISTKIEFIMKVEE